MRIIADENIPYVREAFGGLGDVVTLSGRSMTVADVAGADVLLVRSVTKVNARLLGSSGVRFVGTATIGFDHVDTSYLAQRKIPFHTAAGSNANSVAEYVLAAMLTIGERLGVEWAGKTIGVVGVGNIGRLVVRNAAAMGMRVLQNDPPRQRAEGGDFVDLDTICRESDVITCHVPLTREGPDRTYHLFDRERLDRLRPQTVLLNTSRGAVVDNGGLLDVLRGGSLWATVLDVWEPEPEISVQLFRKVDIGTPHIAGYSFDGKVAGTKMLFDAVCREMGLKAVWDPTTVMPAPPVPRLDVDASGRSDSAILREVVRRVYDIEADDRRMREIVRLPADARAGKFDQLRRDYPIRREFFNTRVTILGASTSLIRTLQVWGFRV